MAATLRKILFAGALSLWSCIASAEPLLYEFTTRLKLYSGPDNNGLSGATIRFTAEIADGTVFELDPFGYGLKTFMPVSHEWSISGSDSVDGTYTDPDGAMYVTDLGWLGGSAGSFDFAPFNAANPTLGVYQTILNAQIGDLVRPEQFGPLFAPEPYFDFWPWWRTQDGSNYNWIDNARFRVTDPSAVPAPPTAVPLPSWLSLAAAALCGLVGTMARRRLGPPTTIAA